MASSVIHMAVAKQLEEKFSIKNKKEYYLGSIAPDLGKIVGETKEGGHFLYNTKKDVPNIKMFTDKYPNFLDNDFELGYYIHLYTDKIWFDGFINNIINENVVKLIDGTDLIISTEEEACNIIYSDYTDLNVKIIDQYDLDLSHFYDDYIIPNTTIDDIPIDKINVLLDKVGIIIENSKSKKDYIFNEYSIIEFINLTCDEILKELKIY